MTRALFYVDALPSLGELAVVDGDEGFHAANVRRIRVGEELDLGDGAGIVAHCVVEDVAKGRLTAKVLDRRTVPVAVPSVTVVQALPKSDRAELAVELATEAGVDALVPWTAARCVARWAGDKGLARWQRTAREAAKQARRAWVPSVAAPVSTRELAVRVAAADCALVLHEAATTALAEVELPAAGEVLLAVGPEGGITDDELSLLTAAGAQAVRLGPEVLRASTAAAVALGALGVLTGRWAR